MVGVDQPRAARDETHGGLSPREQREREFFDGYYSDTSQRDVVRKYYAITRDATALQRRLLTADCAGRQYLEYGCGTGGFAYELAEAGAVVSGIDISQSAIEHCRRRAAAEGLAIEFAQMNAHHTGFPDSRFDIISGLGILHHLELDAAYAELARLLRPEGFAVFREALGGNPLINLYRRRTPQLRSADERPLRLDEVLAARRYFGRVELTFHHFWTLTAVPFRNLPGFGALLAWCRFWDNVMFRLLPFTRGQAWMVTMVLREPKKRLGQ